MILWFAVMAGLISFIYRITGGRWGAPRQESAIAFFRRVAQRTRPLSAVALPNGGVDGVNAYGVRIARRLRPALRWREIPTEGTPFRVFEASDGGGPLPLGPMLVTGSAISPSISGPTYAIQGDISAYLRDLEDRWLTFRPVEALAVHAEPAEAAAPPPAKASEDGAASAAGAAAAAVVSGYVARIGGSGRIEAAPLSADRVLELARGGR